MKAQIVSFHCVLKDKFGRVISSTFNQDIITDIHQPGEMLRGLAEGLSDLKKGERRTILLTADQAYGSYDPELVFEVPRTALARSRNLSPGDQIVGQLPGGQPRRYRVLEAREDTVLLDGNHPLAGQDLVFDIEATEARYATPEEVAEAGDGRGGTRAFTGTRVPDRQIH